MTAQRIPSNGENPETPTAGRLVTARIIVDGVTYEAACATREEARAWLRRMAAQLGSAPRKEGATR